jgi:hypothetical protein
MRGHDHKQPAPDHHAESGGYARVRKRRLTPGTSTMMGASGCITIHRVPGRERPGHAAAGGWRGCYPRRSLSGCGRSAWAGPWHAVWGQAGDTGGSAGGGRASTSASAWSPWYSAAGQSGTGSVLGLCTQVRGACISAIVRCRGVAWHRPGSRSAAAPDALGAPGARSRHIQFCQPAPSHHRFSQLKALSPAEPYWQVDTLPLGAPRGRGWLAWSRLWWQQT